MKAFPSALGVVLAGGQSLRMGKDKALLPHVGCLRWVDHVYSCLQEHCSLGVWVSGRDYGLPFFDDIPNIRGPMAGLLSSQHLWEDSQHLIVFAPVDMPDLNHKCVSEILLAAFQLDDGSCLHPKDDIFPLVFRCGSVLNAKAHQFRLEFMRSGESPSLQSFVSQFRRVEINLETFKLKNINNYQEYLEWKEALR